MMNDTSQKAANQDTSGHQRAQACFPGQSEMARRMRLLLCTFCLSIFPLLGNAFAFDTSIPRRLLQSLVVIGSFILYFRAVPLPRFWAPISGWAG